MGALFLEALEDNSHARVEGRGVYVTQQCDLTMIRHDQPSRNNSLSIIPGAGSAVSRSGRGYRAGADFVWRDAQPSAHPWGVASTAVISFQRRL